MQNLKLEDPSLKTLLAIGGWTHGSNGFKQMVSTKNNRQKFVANSLAYIKQYGECVCLTFEKHFLVQNIDSRHHSFYEF